MGKAPRISLVPAYFLAMRFRLALLVLLPLAACETRTNAEASESAAETAPQETAMDLPREVMSQETIPNEAPRPTEQMEGSLSGRFESKMSTSPGGPRAHREAPSTVSPEGENLPVDPMHAAWLQSQREIRPVRPDSDRVAPVPTPEPESVAGTQSNPDRLREELVFPGSSVIL